MPTTNACRRARLWRALALCLLASACRAPSDAAPEVALAWEAAPAPPQVGPARIHFTLTDRETGRPVEGAAFRVEGTMSHPGMAPSIAEATETAPGTYTADVDFTMAGDWVLLVDARLADGRTMHRQVDVPGVRQAGRTE